ncbi:MAG: hypothetical protein IT306_21440 [Chloroflexi bacterium]|nr:hypothetical protein [Chloroflexota bacterium]
MSTTPIARVAALYRAQTATEQHRMPQENIVQEEVFRARLWQATLAKTMADHNRKRRGR